MKNILPSALVLVTGAFTFAALLKTAGFFALNAITPASVTGALTVIALLAFARSDYRRQPSFRVRRSASSEVPRPGLSAHNVPPDWTYQTRSN